VKRRSKAERSERVLTAREANNTVGALEALFALARRRMFCPFSLHLSALFRFMAPYDAAGRGSKQSVMDGVMTGDASYESTLKAALSIGRRHCRQSQHNGRTFDYRAHFRSKAGRSFPATKLVMMTSESIRFERAAFDRLSFEGISCR
jgi:hypothetical protein